MDQEQKAIDQLLNNFRAELEEELQNILVYWTTNSVDNEKGGFYGKIDCNGRVDPIATKGAVLNARILWTFSAAAQYKKDPSLYNLADRAYEYLIDHFIDKQSGGVYWSIHADGTPADTKKQVYAIAFAIYGLSEYYRCSQKEEAKKNAIRLFELIEEHAYDPVHGGYIEALTKDWQPMNDIRLSAKDANEKKSMNTHLHVLEAYGNLYRIWPDEKLKKQLLRLIDHFLIHIIDPVTHHLILFFDEQWKSRSNLVSFGHDIEASWILAEAAGIAGDQELQKKVNSASLAIANAATEGVDIDGGIFYEYYRDTKTMVNEKHWWPQAEAMVGFFRAWQITGEVNWLNRSVHCWEFVKEFIIDRKKGEWFWGIAADGSVMEKEDKAGFWKCPYHNSRACLEIIYHIQDLNR